VGLLSLAIDNRHIWQPTGQNVRFLGLMSVISQCGEPPAAEVCERIVQRTHCSSGDKVECVFTDGTSILVPTIVAKFLLGGDILRFPLRPTTGNSGAEIYIRRTALQDSQQELLFAEIGYARQPRRDSASHPSVVAELRGRQLGIANVYFHCDSIRNYFYTVDRQRSWDRQPSFYQLLQVNPTAAASELRIAFRLRTLELRTSGASIRSIRGLERAFNILALPERRESYDQLLAGSEIAPFPYCGFGSMLASGTLSRNGSTFFVSRLLSFRPHRSTQLIQAPLRNCTFYDDLALFRDPHRKLEVHLDRIVLPLSWDPSWSRWKHLLGGRVGIKAVFVQSGKYRFHKGAWELRMWGTALPSRIEVTLPEGISDQISKTQHNYHRFGQFAESLERVRTRVESVPIETNELRRLCSRLGMPGDFDVSQITWKADYEVFYYSELCRRARYVYLFRAEYIFDLERVVAVETPQLGHATYLFSKPISMPAFLSRYRLIAREEILQNRKNAAEELGFLCRIIHGRNPQTWLKELKARLGESPACLAWPWGQKG
jgi:hypothetical protein